VHQQPWTGVDLDDGTALCLQRLRDVFGDEVDAGDVQPDRANRQRSCGGHRRVDELGHVEGDVAVSLDQHANALGRYRLGLEALVRELDAGSGVDAHRVQRRVFGTFAAR